MARKMLLLTLLLAGVLLWPVLTSAGLSAGTPYQFQVSNVDWGCMWEQCCYVGNYCCEGWCVWPKQA